MLYSETRWSTVFTIAWDRPLPQNKTLQTEQEVKEKELSSSIAFAFTDNCSSNNKFQGYKYFHPCKFGFKCPLI